MLALRSHILALLALILVCAQGAGLAHASAFGGETHEHDGIACDVALAEDEAQAVLPPAPALPVPTSEWSRPAHVEPTVRALPAPRARAPPARAPPL